MYPAPPLLTSGGQHLTPVQTCSLEDLLTLLILTSSSGHQAGGTHPMESCLVLSICGGLHLDLRVILKFFYVHMRYESTIKPEFLLSTDDQHGR